MFLAIKKFISLKFFFFSLICSTNLLSQSIDSSFISSLYPFIVDSIAIQGNKTTKDFIILRELNFGIGDTLTLSNAHFNRERVYSLGIFNQVNITPYIADSKRILNIEVEESWYIYPIPFIETKEKDINKLSYGVFFRYRNFRGRNEDLTAKVAFGYDPAYYLSYYNPNIVGNENIIFSTTFGYSDISNKSPMAELKAGESFSQNYITAGLILGKRLDLFNRIYLSTGYNYIESPFYIEKVNASNDRIDNVVSIGAGYEHDTRDLIQFPKNGIYASALLTLKGLGIDDISYSVARLEFREYRKILGNLISKWKFSTRFTFGDDVPYYDNSILGVDEKIRGHYFDKYEGNNLYFGSLELYYPVIEEIYVDLTFIPLLPDALLSYRLGFYTQIFAETGLVNYHNNPLTVKNLNSGYGFGLTFLILPYQIIRIEAAFDEYFNSQLIVDFGISF